MTTSKAPALTRLKTAAAATAARAAAAKEKVREAKAQLKAARKLFKAEKKAAKQARHELDDAARAVRSPKPKRPPKGGAPKAGAPKRLPKATPKEAAARRVQHAKARTPPAPETLRSAAEVAKSVIERLHAPPPILPPEPVIPASDPPRTGQTG